MEDIVFIGRPSHELYVRAFVEELRQITAQVRELYRQVDQLELHMREARRPRVRGVALTPNLNENAAVRMLAVIVMIAAGIRIVYWLLLPTLRFLIVIMIAFAVVRVVGWYRGRW